MRYAERLEKDATLPRVPAFEHANPWEGLRVTPKMCNFTSRSVARPRQSIVIFDMWRRTVGKRYNFASRPCVRPCQSMGRVARHAENMQLFFAFSRSNTPIYCNFRYVAPNGWKRYNFTWRLVARPRQSIVIFDALCRTVGKRRNFTSRSCVRPCQSMGRIARHAENVQLYFAFSRSTTPIHCNFRYVAPNGWKKIQLYLVFLRSTIPIHGKGCASR